MSKVSETVVNFAVFEDATEYYGMAEAGLPELKNKTATVTGAGIAGDYESVVLGHSDPLTLTLNFRTFTPECIALHEQKDHKIDLRVAQQSKDTVTGKTIINSVKHVFVVSPKGLSPGKVAPASPADASGEYSVSYWATYIDGKKVLEIDILNFIYFVNGTDYLADVRSALGK